MKVAILGTGQVGSAVGGKLAALGHDVMFGSRSPQSSKAQALAASSGGTVATYAEAAAHGEWVVNALQGESAIPILAGCDIASKILIDIANYDFGSRPSDRRTARTSHPAHLSRGAPR